MHQGYRCESDIAIFAWTATKNLFPDFQLINHIKGGTFEKNRLFRDYRINIE